MKKIVFIVFIAALMLSACHKSDPPEMPVILPEQPKEYPYKIGIYTDMYAGEPEAIAMLNAEKQYNERVTLQFATFDPRLYGMSDAMPEREVLISEALQFIENTKLKVLIFVVAGNMEEPADFLQAIKETRPDIFYIAVYSYPWQNAYGVEDNLMEYSDFELSTDQAATAEKAVEQAKKMGAAACIDYTISDY